MVVSAARLLFAFGLLACLQLLPYAEAELSIGLELAAADVSWRVCRAGFADPRFPGVCGSQSLHNPLHVAVTLSATWWAAPSRLGPDGPGQWAVDADPPQQYVHLPAAAGTAHARTISFKAVGGNSAMTQLPPHSVNPAGAPDGSYAFAVSHAEKLSTKTNSSLHHVTSRLSFMVELPHAGEFELQFAGCCRWADLANIQQKNYPHQVPWTVSSRIVVSADSTLAPSFSPRLFMPITPVVLWHDERRALRLSADNGGPLITLLDDTDISGRYRETASKMSLDSSAYVVAGTQYSAYVREDGLKSIVWFDAPGGGKNQFAASGAWIEGPGWAVIRGDVSSMVGKPPSALDGSRPVLEGMGGIWPSSPMYDELRFMGPCYWGGGAVRLAAKHTKALVEYEHVVKLQTLVPHDHLLPSKLTAPSETTFAMGSLAAPAFVPAGTVLDTAAGMVVLPPGSYRRLCADIRRRAPTLSVCAMALPVTMTVSRGDVRVSVGLDFWVQVLQPTQLVNPLPRIVFPAGGDGEALYTSAETSLHMDCSSVRQVAMQVANVPPLSALAVSQPHPTDQTRATAVGPGFTATTPVSLLHPVPSGWHASDAWDPVHVAVSGNEVTVTLAPQCGAPSSRGLQMVCLQVVYALDDACAPPGAADGCNPSNYGCRLENPGEPGRCYAMSAPSRCLFYTVTDPNEEALERHTAPPAPQATPPPPTPPPAPTQPTIVAVAEPPVASSHVHHVLDFVATLEDPQQQIARGELQLYFVEDLSILKLGQPPADTLRTVFDAQATACLCAGARDLALQKQLLDEWNKAKNNLDKPARGVWYRMGEELMGQTVTMGGASYKWTCIEMVKLDVTKALSREMQVAPPVGDQAQDCTLCWHRADVGTHC